MTHHEPHYLTATNVLLVKHGKVLLSRRQNKGWGDGMLCIPGGHVEDGETPKVAAVREVKEELGIDINPEKLEFLCLEVRRSADRAYLSTIFTLETTVEPTNNEPHECSELVWTDPTALGDDVILNFKNIITDGYLRKVPYLEFIQA